MPDTPLFDSLYNKTLRFLSFRPRSEKEVLDYLKRKKANAENVSKIVKKLKEYNFVNDLDFAKWWIENRKKGKRLVVMELKQKGITKEIIEEAVSIFDLVKKEEGLIEKLIEKKWRTFSKEGEKGYQKMVNFLMRRGFDWDTIKQALKSRRS